MALTKIQKANFEALQAAILGSTEGFIYAVAEDVNCFANENLIEINDAMQDAEGRVAVRLASLPEVEQEQVAVSETVATPVVKTKSAFVLEDNVPMPKGVRTASAAMYPFDEMEIGQSFFVANTEAKPDAAKSLGSTVSSATARYSIEDPSGATELNRKGVEVPVMIVQRKFVVRAVEGGARVWRVEV